MKGRGRRDVQFIAALALAALASGVTPALASEGTPQWTISAVSTPTNINPSAKPGEDFYTVLLTNTGSAVAGCTKAQFESEAHVTKEGAVPTLCPSNSPVVNPDPVTVTDELPAGLSLDPAGASGENTLASYQLLPSKDGFSCALATCAYTRAVVPDQTLVLTFPLDVSAGGGESLTNVLRVSGGGAAAASLSLPTVISEQPAAFGIPPGAATTALSSTQAGAHPDITNSYAFDSVDAGGSPAADTKDLLYRLPPGFASDFADTPVCEVAQFLRTRCPIASQVGVTTVNLLDEGTLKREVEPVYNLVPGPGHLAALGFSIGGEFNIQGEISLAPRRYGAEVAFANLDDGILSVTGGSLTVWGVPADPVHDPLRAENTPRGIYFGIPSDANPAPYFTNPTSCTGAPLQSEFSVDSWKQPGVYAGAPTSYGPIVGCDRLTIEPQFEAQPTSESAETATGLNVNLQLPQHYENAYGDVAANLDDVRVVLPEGITVNPSAGAGLGACSEAQFAYEGGVTEPEAALGCPSDSKLGTAHARSPGVPEHEEATGSLFLARPYENRFGSLLAVYLVLRIPRRGVVVTAAGKVELNPETGQLTTTFDEGPQLPVSDFQLSFHQGATSPLVTPPACGTFSSQADLTPWSEPLQEHLLTSAFEITSGVNGGPCPAGGVPPFAPQVVAGTLNNAAGSYSPLDIKLSRNDGEQEITGFSSQMPPGLTANLTGVAQCSEAQIAAAKAQTGAEAESSPACPSGSEIGHSIAEAGVGQVLAQAPGKIYLGEKYEGAPFSIVSVTAAKVGPFDLGTVVVHLPLFLNPETAQVTVGSGSANQIPHIIKGIVIHVRNIRVYVDRANFILNPTSCAPMSFGATVIGGGANPTNPADDTPVMVNDPFQAADCANLKFKPSFGVSTPAHASRPDGAALAFKIAYPKGATGSESWFHYAKFVIPKQFSARLTTLQKACVAATFEHDRAACPAASIIGHALVHTPILPVPLEGLVYFVSYGGAAFPDVVLVLKGYGVTIELHGHTLIEHKVTSATFETLPDVPFESIEVSLPQGPFSEFGANLPHEGYDYCGQKMTMGTEFRAANGLEIKRNTPVTVTGCPPVPGRGKGRTSAQKLTAALKACKKKPRNRRAACDKAARKAFGAKVSKKVRKR